MKRFIAICLCLAITASVLAAPPRQPGHKDLSPAMVAVSTAVRLLAWRVGILIPASDGLTPPVPGPASKPTTCCR